MIVLIRVPSYDFVRLNIKGVEMSEIQSDIVRASADTVFSAGYGEMVSIGAGLGLELGVGAGLMATHAIIANTIEMVAKSVFRSFYHKFCQYGVLKDFLFQTVALSMTASVAVLSGITLQKVILIWAATRVVDFAMSIAIQWRSAKQVTLLHTLRDTTIGIAAQVEEMESDPRSFPFARHLFSNRGRIGDYS